MGLREIVLAALLAVSAASVVVGVAMVSPPAAWIVGGLFGAVWSWLVAGDS